MENASVYLDEERKGLVICKECGKSKQIDFSSRKVPRSAQVKCSCNNTFLVFFEKRRHYRKGISANGMCFATGDSDNGFPIKIVNVSQGGMHFLNTGRKSLQLNQIIRVVFPLGDKTIKCSVSVCHIQNERVGAKITSMDESSKKAWGFFLFP